MLHIKSAFSQDFSGAWCVQARVKGLPIHPVRAKGLIIETEPNRFVDAACYRAIPKRETSNRD